MHANRKPPLIIALFLFLSLCCLSLTPSSQAATSKGKQEAGGKKAGFNGDPAKKRGLEIGFDQGQKAGKSDLEQKLSPDPRRHEEYSKPEKFFRHEYGSQASFSSGFRSGFVGGYQTAFGKKVPHSVSDSSYGVSGIKPKTASGSGGTKKTSGGSSDAL
jgi:hypothetical protein